MHQAVLYESLPNGLVKCTACARYCHIGDGCAGYCGVRKNAGGKLFLEVYGKPAALAIDPVEKKPLFHFLPGTKILSMGTYGCNFACEFCQNYDLSQFPKLVGGPEETVAGKRMLLEKEIGALSEVTPGDFAKSASGHGCSSVAFTYNEPTIFAEYAYDCSKEARKLGLKAVFVSSGYESYESMKYMSPVLDAINIDLKSFSDRFYREICHTTLEPVLESIKLAHALGIWTEVTTLVIPGENDSEEELRSIADFIKSVDRDVPWHVTAFHPDYKMLGFPPTPPEKLVEARQIGLDAGLRYAYAGNLPIEYSKYENTN